MIRKGGNRFSEKIMLKQKAEAGVGFNSVESDASGGIADVPKVRVVGRHVDR
jgi:hypothetical protein